MIVAAGSEYLQYRSTVYIVAGFAGVVALSLMLMQPLLAAGVFPGRAVELLECELQFLNLI